MQRREFLYAAGAAGLSVAASRAAHGEPAPTPHPLRVTRSESDRFRLDFAPPDARPLRILQVTDTHFGKRDLVSQVEDQRSFVEIKRMVEQLRPDFIVHTGDFINNDGGPKISFEAIDVFDDLGVPWTHALGNHDIGARSVSDFRQLMKHAAVGEFRGPAGDEYAFRLDIHRPGQSAADYTLFCFDSGFRKPQQRVNREQLEWFAAHMNRDAQQSIATPCLAMIHIPVVEFETMRAANRQQGNYGEKVCFDNDTGDTFAAFQKSARVRGVFSGHDHENDYCGTWEGIELVYGRVGGWSAYGDLPRGGRLIEIDLAAQTYSHRLVFPQA
ncbi:MAG: metallophosphoesterase [Pirellulales bacterium]